MDKKNQLFFNIIRLVYDVHNIINFRTLLNLNTYIDINIINISFIYVLYLFWGFKIFILNVFRVLKRNIS